MQKKGTKQILFSAIVFTNSVPNILGVGYKNAIFAENPIKIVASTYFGKKRKKGAKNVKKVESKR